MVEIEPGGEFLTVAEVKRAHRGHWFDRGTLEFFDAKIGRLFGGRFLVSSTRYESSTGWSPGRKWHIHYVTADGQLHGLPGSYTVQLSFPTEHDAERLAEAFEAETYALEKVQYGVTKCEASLARQCVPNTLASWLLNGTALCWSDTATQLECWRETGMFFGAARV